MKKYCNSERTLLYSDRTKRNFAVNVPEINTKTKEKNEANRQYEEYLNNYHTSFENSPIFLFNEGDNLDYERDTTDNVEVDQKVDDLIDLQDEGGTADIEEDCDDTQFEGEADSVDQFLFQNSTQEEADLLEYES